MRSTGWRGAVVGACLLMSCSGLSSAQAVESEQLVATKSATVMRNGHRSGENGKKYFNVQGRDSGDSGQFASFGVLDFVAPKLDLGERRIELTLTLTQSLARFSLDGQVKVYLTTETQLDINPAKPPPAPVLRFEADTRDGLGRQLQPRYLLGPSAFNAVRTGYPHSFALTLDEELRTYLKEQLAKGGMIRLIVAPDDDHVAATYFGVGEAAVSSRPKLTIDIHDKP